MSIISNYENLNSDYHPNNMSVRQPFIREEYQHTLPYRVYDFTGDFTGYSWNYNDTLSITFNVNPTIMVESDALIYTVAGETPNETTEGKLGQRAYNTYDFKYWVCKTFDQTTNVWELQSEFTYPVNITDGKEIRLFVYKDINNFTGKVIIRNFRWEEVLFVDVVGADTVTVNITPEISAQLIKGIYYGEIELKNGENSIKIYTDPLIVK